MPDTDLANRLAIFYRDAWHCRFCRKPVFLRQALKLMDELAPGHGYFHPNSKTGAAVGLLIRLQATAVPVPGLDRRVTACEHCGHGVKASDLRDIPEGLRRLNWDGFSALYQVMKEADPVVVELLQDAALGRLD